MHWNLSRLACQSRLEEPLPFKFHEHNDTFIISYLLSQVGAVQPNTSCEKRALPAFQAVTRSASGLTPVLFKPS